MTETGKSRVASPTGLCFFSSIYKYEKALFSAKRIPSPDGRDLLIKVLIHMAQHLNNLSFG